MMRRFGILLFSASIAAVLVPALHAQDIYVWATTHVNSDQDVVWANCRTAVDDAYYGDLAGVECQLCSQAPDGSRSYTPWWYCGMARKLNHQAGLAVQDTNADPVCTGNSLTLPDVPGYFYQVNAYSTVWFTNDPNPDNPGGCYDPDTGENVDCWLDAYDYGDEYLTFVNEGHVYPVCPYSVTCPGGAGFWWEAEFSEVAYTYAYTTTTLISPKNPVVAAGKQITFTATYSGTQWSVISGSGTINSSGVYTAPSTTAGDTLEKDQVKGCNPDPANTDCDSTTVYVVPMPSIGSVTNPLTASGTAVPVTIAGSGFYNPTVTFSQGDIQWNQTSWNDRTITGIVTILPTTTDTSATATVTNTYNAFTVSATSGSVAVVLPPMAPPSPPQIMLGVNGGSICQSGTNAAGTTQQVWFIGQQTAFTACIPPPPGGATIVSESWSLADASGNPMPLADNAVGGYPTPGQPATPPASPSCGVGPSCDYPPFYWVEQQTGATFTFQYMVQDQYNRLASASSYVAFDVDGPDGGITVTPGGYVHVGTYPANGFIMVFAGLKVPGGETGIQFSAPPPPPQNIGLYQWVQLVTSDTLKAYSMANGVLENCTPTSGSITGLDGAWPYPNMRKTQYTNDTATDNPWFPLGSFYGGTRSFGATMYLMWNSESANSIWVPLGYVTWHFSDTVINTLDPAQGYQGTDPTQGMQGWIALCGPGDGGSNPFQASSIYPVFSQSPGQVVTQGGNWSCAP